MLTCIAATGYIESAPQVVFNTVELVESILLHLTNKDLFLLQYTNTTFERTIATSPQLRRILRWEDDAPGLVLGAIEYNPIFFERTLRIDTMRSTIRINRINKKLTVYGELDSLVSGKGERVRGKLDEVRIFRMSPLWPGGPLPFGVCIMRLAGRVTRTRFVLEDWSTPGKVVDRMIALAAAAQRG